MRSASLCLKAEIEAVRQLWASLVPQHSGACKCLSLVPDSPGLSECNHPDRTSVQLA